MPLHLISFLSIELDESNCYFYPIGASSPTLMYVVNQALTDHI